MTAAVDSKTLRVSPFLWALVVGPILGVVGVTIGFILIGLPILALLSWLGIPDQVWMVLLLAPALGVFYGLPYYATAGALAFILTIRAGRTEVMDFARAAFLANLASPLLSLPFYQDGDYALFLLAFGSIAAPVWGASFGLVFRSMGGGEG